LAWKQAQSFGFAFERRQFAEVFAGDDAKRGLVRADGPRLSHREAIEALQFWRLPMR